MYKHGIYIHVDGVLFNDKKGVKHVCYMIKLWMNAKWRKDIDYIFSHPIFMKGYKSAALGTQSMLIFPVIRGNGEWRVPLDGLKFLFVHFKCQVFACLPGTYT